MKKMEEALTAFLMMMFAAKLLRTINIKETSVSSRLLRLLIDLKRKASSHGCGAGTSLFSPLLFNQQKIR